MGFEVYLATGGNIRIGEDAPEEDQIFRDLWEDETQREEVIDKALKADCEVRRGRPRESLRCRLAEIRGVCVCAEG